MPGPSFSLRISRPQLLLLAFFLAGCVVAVATESDPWLRPATAPAPADNVPNAARIKLGQMLFFDPRLSRKASMSCATCHNPSLGWTDGLPTAVGFDMAILGRNTPTIVNTSFNTIQMWDGRKRDLEDQATGPIAAAGEMNLPLPELIERLKAIPGYAHYFDDAYPGQGVSDVTVARAIASFERTVLSTESPFDRWRKGDEHAVSEPAKRGFEVFQGKAKCAVCHMGYNFTDNGFHNIGIKTPEGKTPDIGRFAQKPVKSMRGAFKTPTLRDIGLTGPYMRNGCYQTLVEVVEHYNRGGDDQENLDLNIVPLRLTPDEKQELVAFLGTLDGAPMQVTVPALPH
jgi:cytochrome c peroxidase